MRICFDMDGTIANLYGVDGWLDMILAHDATPYAQAKVLLNMNVLARILNNLQKKGYEIGIISWLAKGSTVEYDEAVTRAKKKWLTQHLKSVQFDFVEIVAYGTDKNIVATGKTDILFDDEARNRNNWCGVAYNVDNIIEVLKGLNQTFGDFGPGHRTKKLKKVLTNK